MFFGLIGLNLFLRNEITREAMKNGSIQKILINGAPVLSIGDGVMPVK